VQALSLRRRAHLLTGARNVSATNVCEAVTSIYNALHDASRLEEGRSGVGLAVTVEWDRHLTISLVIEKAQFASHRRLLEMLLSFAA
jgi:hypothetical protein